MTGTKAKLLILPSWYISPDDRINGSFFQAQGRLLSENFETRVISFKPRTRPSLRKFAKSPLKSARDWVEYISFRPRQVKLPEEEVFKTPKLFQYTSRRPLFWIKAHHEWIISAWVAHVEEMIASGWRPDLIRAHTGFPAGVAARRIKKRHGIPYVLSEHLPFNIYKYDRSLRSEIKAAFEEADRVLSLGYDKVRQLAMSDIEVEPHIVFNVVDEELFKGLAERYRPGQPLKLVTIGAASFYKDHETLLRAVRAALDLGVPLHLTMIGLAVWGGDKLAKTHQLIDVLNLRQSVTIIDKLSQAEVSEFLPDFHVFLMTSIQEGFPNAVLEALASGLFVIATRHGGTEDLINRHVGRIVPVRNYQMIAGALHRIYLGEITFCPDEIRNFVIDKCGREAYTSRIIAHLSDAMRNGNA